MPNEEALQHHLAFKMQASTNYEAIITEIKKPTGTTNTGRDCCMILHKGVFYFEMENKTNAKIFNDEAERKSALTDFTTYTGTAYDKANNDFIAWNISETTYRNLLKEGKLTASGTIVDPMVKIVHENYFDKTNTPLPSQITDVAFLHNEFAQIAIREAAIKYDINPNNYKSDWSRTAKSIATIDAIWAIFGPMLYFIPKEYEGDYGLTQELALEVANYAFPFMLAFIVYFVNKRAQIQAYREKYGKEPSPAVIAQIEKDSFDLACKVFCAVGGWTFGYEYVLQVLFEIDPTGLSHLGRVGAGFIIGVTAALCLVIAAAIITKARGQELDGVALGKLFVIGTLAGAAWFITNSYIYMPKLDFNETLCKVIDYIFKGILTYTAVSSIFMFMKPEQSSRELKNTKGYFWGSDANTLTPGFVLTNNKAEMDNRKIEIETEVNALPSPLCKQI